jgi:hypothetical protein
MHCAPSGHRGSTAAASQNTSFLLRAMSSRDPGKYLTVIIVIVSDIDYYYYYYYYYYYCYHGFAGPHQLHQADRLATSLDNQIS